MAFKEKFLTHATCLSLVNNSSTPKTQLKELPPLEIPIIRVKEK
jgi:hypothetical protein